MNKQYQYYEEMKREQKERESQRISNIRKNEMKILNQYMKLRDLDSTYDWAANEYVIIDKVGRSAIIPKSIFLETNFSELAIKIIEQAIGKLEV